jgi:CRISPR-associated endonuclease/helicase Cas3
MTAYAHSKDHEPPDRWHPLEDHLRATAAKAQGFAAPWAAGEWAWNAGWLHNLGAVSYEFGVWTSRNGLSTNLDGEHDK